MDTWSGTHKGSDIYVLGSGPTIGYVDPGFLDGKIVVATNRVGERMGLYDRPCILYTHSHYHREDTVPLARKHPKHQFFAPMGEQGFAGVPLEADRLRNIHYYPHVPTTFEFNIHDAWPPQGGLIVGSTSLHGSLHLACELGAATVILIGADCATLDDDTNMTGYKSGDLKVNNPYPWLRRWQHHLMQVKGKLEDEYGARIYSILPFANGNMDGHLWRS